MKTAWRFVRQDKITFSIALKRSWTLEKVKCDKTHFQKYVNMIRSRVWQCVKRYGLEYEDVEAQGFLIYCNAIEKFDFTKSTFSTYLYIELNRLADYCVSQIRRKNTQLDDEMQNHLVASNESITIKNLLVEAMQNLSMDAYNIFEWIIGREWENVESMQKKPSISTAYTTFNNWNKSRVLQAWNEVGQYWNAFC